MHFFYIKICGIPFFGSPFWSTGCEAVPPLPRPKIEMSMCSPCRDLGFVFSFFVEVGKEKTWDSMIHGAFFSFLFVFNFGLKSSF